jgi:hypothetical protein
LNSKQSATLKTIFTVPVPSDLKWRDIESLLIGLGAVIKEGRGSRVRVALNGVRAVFHEPHPTNKEVCKCTVKDVRDFLESAEITPY